jgi:hypothetical protein
VGKTNDLKWFEVKNRGRIMCKGWNVDARRKKKQTQLLSRREAIDINNYQADIMK